MSVLSLTHPNRLVNLFAFATKVISNVLAIGQSLKHGKNLEFFALPGFEIESLWVLNIREICQRVEL